MFGIITFKKDEIFDEWRSKLYNGASVECFEYGFFSFFPEEEKHIVAKDNSGEKILIFKGEPRPCNDKSDFKLDRNKISETIFSMYLEKGIDFLSYLKGDFILGLYDKNTNTFILARDRLGTKHIYYSIQDGRFIFSSNIKYFYYYDLIDKNVDLNALNLYFSFKFVPAPHTIFKNIFKLPCASVIIWENGDRYIKKYKEIKRNYSARRNTFGDDVVEVERLIKKSIEMRISDTKNICSYLSGGIDSSVVAGLASTFKEKNISVFCANDGKNHRDVKYARLVASNFKINNYYEKLIDWPDVVEYLPEVIKLIEEPIGDPSGLHLYLISKLARSYGDKILSGEGGDVLFGGHNFCYLLDISDKLSVIEPKKLLDYMSKASFSPSLRYRLLALRDSKSREKSFLNILSAFPNDDKEKIFTSEIKKKMDTNLDIELLRPYFEKDGYFMDSLTIFLLENYVSDMFLMRVNKLSSASSVMHIAPFLDENLVEYLFTIEKSRIYNIVNKKAILKKILGRLNVNQNVIYRKKEGLAVPIGDWMGKGLDNWMRNLLNYKNISSQGFFNFSYIDRIFKAAETDLRAQWQLWGIAIFTLWFKIFISEEDVL